MYSQFAPTPWMLSEFNSGTAGTSLTDDLKAMDQAAAADGNFLGAIFAQFQHDYVADTKFGMFGLGNTTVGNVNPCYEDVLSKTKYCFTYPVYCLDAASGDGGRAASVAAAWGGKLAGKGLCGNSTATRVDAIVV